MLERLLKHRSSVAEFTESRPLQSLTDAEWVKLKNMTDLLKPLKAATNELGGDKYVTASVVLPMLSNLIHMYMADEDDPLYVSKFKGALREKLELSRDTLRGNMFIKSATALDPRFKKLKCIAQADRADVWDHLVSLLKLYLEDMSARNKVTMPEGTPRHGKRAYESSDEDEELPETSSAYQTAKQAVQTYRAVNQVSEESADPLTWWKLNGAQHPLLAMLAKKHLCCPGTSVPAERLFSKAGNVVTEKRASLLPTNANNLICLSSWL